MHPGVNDRTPITDTMTLLHKHLVNTSQTDIAIIGAGPAGLAAAAACAKKGLDVTVFSPDEHPAWPNQYAAWVDEVRALDLDQTLAQTWSSVAVWTEEDAPTVLKRAYGVFDNARLRDHLLAHLNEGHWVAARVTALEHGPTGSRLELSNGETWQAGLVIDATGTGQWLERSGPEPSAFQTAYGIQARVEEWRGPADQASFMDYRDPGPKAPPLPGPGASFLYALPRDKEEVFLEETVLIGNPAVPIELLKQRLFARLSAQGIQIREVLHEERCRIPMDLALPEMPQQTVGFGAAAGWIHPATGYSVVTSLQKAPLLAQALHQNRTSPGARAAAAWAAIWSPAERTCHDLYRFGGLSAVSFNTHQTRDFLRAFFALPTAQWSDYLGRQLTPWALRWTMLGLYGRTSRSVRRQLHRTVREHAASLAPPWRQRP